MPDAATYIEIAQERYALDPDYRARVQKELFRTDTHRARMAEWESRKWELARKERDAA